MTDDGVLFKLYRLNFGLDYFGVFFLQVFIIVCIVYLCVNNVKRTENGSGPRRNRCINGIHLSHSNSTFNIFFNETRKQQKKKLAYW